MKNWFVIALMLPFITLTAEINNADYRISFEGIGLHLEYIIPPEKIENLINKLRFLKAHRDNYMNDIEVTLFNINYGRVTSARLSSQFINELAQGLKKVGLPN